MKDSSQAPEQNDWKEFKPLFGANRLSEKGAIAVFFEAPEIPAL